MEKFLVCLIYGPSSAIVFHWFLYVKHQAVLPFTVGSYYRFQQSFSLRINKAAEVLSYLSTLARIDCRGLELTVADDSHRIADAPSCGNNNWTCRSLLPEVIAMVVWKYYFRRANIQRKRLLPPERSHCCGGYFSKKKSYEFFKNARDIFLPLRLILFTFLTV